MTTITTTTTLLLLTVLCAGHIVQASEPPPFEKTITISTGTKKYVGKKKIKEHMLFIVKPTGEITRINYPKGFGPLGTFEKLPNCHYLSVTKGQVIEFTEHGKLISDFNPHKEKRWVNWYKKLANGNILIGLASKEERNPKGKKPRFVISGSPRIIEQTPTGEIVKNIILEFTPSQTEAISHQIRDIKQLDNGNFLVAHHTASAVHEYTPDGKLAKVIFNFKESEKYKRNYQVICVDRCDNGNTLIGTAEKNAAGVFEVNPEGEVVWELLRKDLPEAQLGYITMVKKLDNGNILIVNNAGHDREWSGIPVLEISPDKKIVRALLSNEKFLTAYWAIIHDYS